MSWSAGHAVERESGVKRTDAAGHLTIRYCTNIGRWKYGKELAIVTDLMQCKLIRSNSCRGETSRHDTERSKSDLLRGTGRKPAEKNLLTIC